MTPAQHIHVHATKHLGTRGRIRVTGVKREANLYSAIVELITPHAIETYRAWFGGGAIGMIYTRTTIISAMPLFV
ncbi:hypothetical protein [Zavarzinella formosa]|uniref:hypothetical protein n=1 Tax=Zavarzinella formosa TaxID=360055 RepID=UPI0002ED7527|nr:hypothetical protein [Zavarzinella formosa]